MNLELGKRSELFEMLDKIYRWTPVSAKLNCIRESYVCWNNRNSIESAVNRIASHISQFGNAIARSHTHKPDLYIQIAWNSRLKHWISMMSEDMNDMRDSAHRFPSGSIHNDCHGCDAMRNSSFKLLQPNSNYINMAARMLHGFLMWFICKHLNAT